MITLSTFVLGFVSSLVTELLTWLNKKLSGTVLSGDAAWILSALVAIGIATFKILHSGAPTSWATFSTQCATIWSLSQVYFMAVVQWFAVPTMPVQIVVAEPVAQPTTPTTPAV